MPAVDTNVLVRLLVSDDARRSALARSLVERCDNSGEALFVPVTVTLELEWVLRARFGLARDKILETFVDLLETRELLFHEEASVERALYFFRSTSADFAECLHLGAAITHGHTPLMTFDRQASRLQGAQPLQ